MDLSQKGGATQKRLGTTGLDHTQNLAAGKQTFNRFNLNILI